MKRFLLLSFLFFTCCIAFVQGQNVNQNIIVYGHDYGSKYEGGEHIETREIEIKNNSPYMLCISSVYAYNYSTGNVFFIMNYSNGYVYPYSSIYVNVENNSSSNQYLNNTWVICISYLNCNDYSGYVKEVKTNKGQISSNEVFDDLNPAPPVYDEILEVEPNNTIDEANELGENPIRFNLSSSDDQDYFKVYANRNDDIRFKINHLSYNNLYNNVTFCNDFYTPTLQYAGGGSFTFNSYIGDEELVFSASYYDGYYYVKIYFDHNFPMENYDNSDLTIQAFVNGQPVSVDNVKNNKVTISGYDGKIHIENVLNKKISIYSIDGKLLHTEQSENSSLSISFPKGLYLVKVGTLSKKINL